MKVKINYLRKLLYNKLTAAGFNKNDAVVIAEEYLHGEIRGNESHGVLGFSDSVVNKLSKVVKTRGKFKVQKKGNSFIYIDGNRDFGQIVAGYAIKQGIQKAKKNGIAIVGCGNVHSYMRPGTWAEYAAKKNMIAICMNYGGNPKVAPTGAKEPILATNPIGIGIPNKEFPIVIDMATSHRAFWHVKKALKFNQRIEKGLAMDKFGKDTTDPKKVFALNPMGGYKGYILGLFLEVLTGPFVGTKVGKSTKNIRGFTFIVINPYLFYSKKEFSKNVNKLLKDIKTAKRKKGVKEILIPGERAYEIEKKNLKNGYLEIDKRIIESIEKL